MDNRVPEIYAHNREVCQKTYWEGNDGTDLYRPNGFTSSPTSAYRDLLKQVTHSGKVLDLGCGNGLMLRYLMDNSAFALTPYGVDFLELSIQQARKIVHPKYKDNFAAGNVVDYQYEDSPFDFIFISPNIIHIDDIDFTLRAAWDACAGGGRLILYGYRSAPEHNGGAWIGGYWPQIDQWACEVNVEIEHKDYPDVAIGICDKKG